MLSFLRNGVSGHGAQCQRWLTHALHLGPSAARTPHRFLCAPIIDGYSVIGVARTDIQLNKDDSASC